MDLFCSHSPSYITLLECNTVGVLLQEILATVVLYKRELRILIIIQKRKATKNNRLCICLILLVQSSTCVMVYLSSLSKIFSFLGKKRPYALFCYSKYGMYLK